MKAKRQPRHQLRYTKSHPSDQYIARQALQGIKSIRPFFHRIVFSSQLKYRDLDLMFQSKLMQPNNSGELACRQTGNFYNNVAWAHLPISKKRITIYHFPSQPYYPASRISITDPSIEELIELQILTSSRSGSPELFFSSIEYTIDLFCHTSKDVGNLYYFLRRNFYCPHAKRTELLGGDFLGYSHAQDYSADRETNSVYLINFSKKQSVKASKKLKFYERGPDNAKNSSETFWQHDNCDRVRFEATFAHQILKDNSIVEIKDLLLSPKFLELIFQSERNQQLFQFKQFKQRD